MHKSLKISRPEDLKQLQQYLDAEFWDEGWMDELSAKISPALKSVIIEYPYVDKDYRSTYYNFYTKKGLKYSAYCVRIHFFDAEVSLTDELVVNSENDLNSCYMGFIVLRPTGVNPLGRSAISPKLIKGVSGYLMACEHHVHLLGHRLKVLAFPFMSQHTDVSVCAHVACWSILRYYNIRFPLYAELLTYDITRMATMYKEGGLIPSRGLNVEQATNILSQGNCFPDLYSKESFDTAEFYRLLYSYIESGFPVFAAMHNIGHAISIIGHGNILDKKINSSTATNDINYSWDYIQSFSVVDDNFLPYMMVTNDKKNAPYTINDIDAFIVPLPEKIYFPSEAVMEHIESFLNNANLIDLSFINKPVVRYFLTSASSYKKHLNCENELPREIYLACIELPMSKFIWVAEISSEADWLNNKTSVTLIFDATANKHENTPFFLIHDQHHIVVFDRAERKEIGTIPFNNPPQSYPQYKNNLLPYN